MRQISSILYHCPRPRYHNRSFSQSSHRPARPKQYTPEQLAAFKNHYATLGLSDTATDEDIKLAYRTLSLRFHPDMMRNVDSKEYWDNPDRPEFIKVSTPSGAQSESTPTVMPAEGKGSLSSCRTYLLTQKEKIKEAYEILRDPTKRRAYDAEYNDVLRALQPLKAAHNAARGVDPKRAMASHLRLDHPTALPDGSPVRDHCKVQVAGLPPQVTAADLLRAVAEMGSVGRIIDCRMMRPSQTRVDRSAFIEFPNDGCAQRFGLLAFQGKLCVLRKRVWHCRLWPLNGSTLRPAPPDATRVLVVQGPGGHRLMTTDALGEFFDSVGLKQRTDSYRVVGSATAPGSVVIEWVFTSWRGAATFAYRELRRECPDLTVTYGKDPCE